MMARAFRFSPLFTLGFAGCALVLPYDGYQLAEHDAGVDAAKGGAAGVLGDASFGASGGTLVSGGSSGASATGGASGASGGTTPSGGTGGLAGGGGTVSGGGGTVSGGGGSGGIANECAGQPDGTACNNGTTFCSTSTLMGYSICQGQSCENKLKDCSPYRCVSSACLTSCAGSTDCALPSYKCVDSKCQACQLCSEIMNSGSSGSAPACPTDSTTLWQSLQACCSLQCEAYCGVFTVCGGNGVPPDSNCIGCLFNNGCSSKLADCNGDIPE